MVTATIGLSDPLSTPFYGGTGTSTEVPGKWDVALNGLVAMFDTKYLGGSYDGRIRRPSIPLLKPQQDTSGVIGDRSLNPEDLVRQAAESWHKGAGQIYFDRAESDTNRFRASKGIDPFGEKFRFQLLPDTALKSSSAQTVMATCVAGTRLYRINGTTVEWTADITVGSPAWTAVTGLPAGAPTSICTDGYTVYIACTANGIYTTNTATNAASSWATGTVTLVAWVKGRLMAAGGGSIYNVIASGALPSPLNSTLNTAITWVAFAEGPNHIYAAGYTGTRSYIYKTTIAGDGTGLAAPSVAVTLPDGASIRSLFGYQGYIFAGTDAALWICQPDLNGNLIQNKILDVAHAIQCFDAQDRFVYFGFTNYDASSTGLGRLDLGVDISDRQVPTPAYASDLMTTYGTAVQGAVLTVCTFQGIRYFGVSGAGWWAQDTVKVPSATLTTGLISFDLADRKVAVWATIAHEQLAGAVSVAVVADGGDSSAFSTIGGSADAGKTSSTLPVGELLGETFELQFTLTRSTVDTTTGPKMTRWILEANPAPGRGETFQVALLLYRNVTCRGGAEQAYDVHGVYQALIELEQSGRPLTYQDAWGTETVFLDDHEFISHEYDAGGHQGTFVADLRRPRRRSL